jgi:hypothetical protein
LNYSCKITVLYWDYYYKTEKSEEIRPVPPQRDTRFAPWKTIKRRRFDDKVAPAILVDGRGLGIYW